MIVLTSDHGDYMGDHWLGEKDWLHDEVVRVPMIVVDPRPAADVTRTVSSELVEAIDLVPTFVDAAGEITPEIDRWLEGQPLTPLLHGRPQEREMAICQSEFAYVELGPTDDLAAGEPRCCERIASSTSSARPGLTCSTTSMMIPASSGTEVMILAWPMSAPN